MEKGCNSCDANADWITSTGIAGKAVGVLPVILSAAKDLCVRRARPFAEFTLVSTIALNHAICQAKIADKWLRFANHLSRLVVLGMLLMLVGVVLWGFALALFAPGWFIVLVLLLTFPWNSWLLIALGMLLAVIVALWASFSHVQTPASQPRPHDASPSESDSC